MVRDMSTMFVMSNRESGFDSGKEAGVVATTFNEDSRHATSHQQHRDDMTKITIGDYTEAL